MSETSTRQPNGGVTITLQHLWTLVGLLTVFAGLIFSYVDVRDTALRAHARLDDLQEELRQERPCEERQQGDQPAATSTGR